MPVILLTRLARLALLAAAGGLLAACQQAAPPASAPASVPEPVPQGAAPAPPARVVPAIVVPPGVTLPSLDFPPGALYTCDVGGSKSSIDYEPRVEQLCRKHPEMGPCQYERNQCRARGGRVFTQKGEEVTPAVESEYDRVVRRVRFQADGGGTAPKPAAKASGKAPAKTGTATKPAASTTAGAQAGKGHASAGK